MENRMSRVIDFKSGLKLQLSGRINEISLTIQKDGKRLTIEKDELRHLAEICIEGMPCYEMANIFVNYIPYLLDEDQMLKFYGDEN